MNTVVISGIGFATSIGTRYDQVHESLRELNNGFKRKRFGSDGDGEEAGIELVCGDVSGFDLSSCDFRDWVYPDSLPLDTGILRSLPTHGPYAVAALEEAINMAEIERKTLGNGRCGLYCASPGSPSMTRQHLNQMAGNSWRRCPPMAIVNSIAGTLNFNLTTHYGITGSSCGFVSACASSSHAIGYAFDEIALGRQDLMLIVAAEDGSTESLLPFLGMRALSLNPDPGTASRPFDQQRDGFVGTGGAAALVLESATSARQRDSTPVAEMLGWGQASDGYNVAAPHPQGEGIRRAMEICLQTSGVEAEQIDWINAHATSTPAGDCAEATALADLGFAEDEIDTSISSTKGLTGHGLSYAGVLEAAICALAIKEDLIPGNAGLEQIDASCAGLNLPGVSRSQPLNFVLNNSCGFGGANVCHLFAPIT